MRDYDVEIIGEYYLPVRHCLASKADSIKKIKEVYSHPQALMQCENFLKKYNLQPKPFADTAGSAQYVASNSKTNI
jgi:prephenate dehydratase